MSKSNRCISEKDVKRVLASSRPYEEITAQELVAAAIFFASFDLPVTERSLYALAELFALTRCDDWRRGS